MIVVSPTASWEAGADAASFGALVSGDGVDRDPLDGAV
jgi:hypothetical protein